MNVRSVTKNGKPDMKKPSILIGLTGGIMTMAVAPGLACGEYYISSALVFLFGLAIIDWNRGGQ